MKQGKKCVGIWALLAAANFLAAGCNNDKVHLTNGATGENGILVDGTKRGSSVNDERFAGAAGSDIAIGRFTRSGEVIGYTNDHPPTLKAGVAWTAGSDTVNLAFENKYLVPFYIWIVKGPYADQRMVAINASVRTSQIWTNERQGIGFSVFQINDATAAPEAPSFYAFTCAAMAADIKLKIGFNSGGINIYYVDTVDSVTTKGIACGGGVVAMGKRTSDHLLSHEIGHGFNLVHVNSLTSFFDTTNVMHPASNNRNYLTEGQTFRAVVNSGSFINRVYNARPGLITRDCGNSTSTTDFSCPAVQKRIWSDGATWLPN